MKAKDYFLYSGIIFLAVFLVHGLRAILGWDAAIGGWDVPMWISWAAIVAAGYLAYNAFHLGGFIK